MRYLVKLYLLLQTFFLSIKVCFPTSMTWITAFMPTIAPVLMISMLGGVCIIIFLIAMVS